MNMFILVLYDFDLPFAQILFIISFNIEGFKISSYQNCVYVNKLALDFFTVI